MTGSIRDIGIFETPTRAYKRVLSTFREWVSKSSIGTFRPQTAVVTYVNRFALGSEESLKDFVAPLNPTWTMFADASAEVRVTVTATVPEPDGSPGVAGQLVATATTDSADYGYLEVWTRININEPDGDIFRRLDLAHEYNVSGFEKLTTPKMHERWGKE